MRKVGVLALVLIAVFAAMSSAMAADGGRKFTTTLTGAAEVNAAGVPNQGDLDGIGTATITLNHGQGEVCWKISVSGITLPAAAAHIHAAPATTTGSVVVPLSAPGADGSSSGCANADRALIKAIIQNPDAYYVNVHNTDYTAGALRGQLSK